MTALDEWVDRVRAELDLGVTDTALVLDLARDVAHGVMRPAAPVTAYLAGLAVGQGADPRRVAATITELARTWRPAGAEPAAQGPSTSDAGDGDGDGDGDGTTVPVSPEPPD
jgi:hypothetical protein